ncbi:hypothetical protein FGB62_283g01 [Gracilaria domingensis]|nr:hypothetical protein FGB62_283g01 [Gracilaria domingensis]
MSIGGQLLDDAYKRCMEEVILYIGDKKGGVVAIDRATNKLFKSVSNIIIHTKLPLLAKYLQSDLNTDRTSNVVLKIKEAMKFLDDIIDFEAGAKLQDAEVFRWCYGCRSYRLHNLAEDVGRISHISMVLKEAFNIYRESHVLCCRYYTHHQGRPLHVRTAA